MSALFIPLAINLSCPWSGKVSKMARNHARNSALCEMPCSNETSCRTSYHNGGAVLANRFVASLFSLQVYATQCNASCNLYAIIEKVAKCVARKIALLACIIKGLSKVFRYNEPILLKRPAFRLRDPCMPYSLLIG